MEAHTLSTNIIAIQPVMLRTAKNVSQQTNIRVLYAMINSLKNLVLIIILMFVIPLAMQPIAPNVN